MSTGLSPSVRAHAVALSHVEPHRSKSSSRSMARSGRNATSNRTDGENKHTSRNQNNAISKTSASVLDAVRTKSKDVAPFLRNLRRMLSEESDAVLRWTPDGRAFEIHDMQRMGDSVLPKYFKHRKYTSFQRQLNYFGFRKWTKSKALVCTFSNDYFLRDQPALACYISRKTTSVQLGGLKPSPRSVRECTRIRDVSSERVAQFMEVTRFDARRERGSVGASARRSSSSACGRAVDEVALLVPHSKLMEDACRETQPSPTSMAVLLGRRVAEAHWFASRHVRHHGHHHLHGYNNISNSNSVGATSGMTSFRWIDDPFLPSLAADRAQDGDGARYFGHQVLSRSAAHMPHPALGSDTVESPNM